MTHDLAIIGAIGQILALCGLISIRMFTPAFLYFFMMRLALTHPDSMLASKMLRQFAEHASWQISPTFLTILGVLSVLELVAIRIPDVKEFLVEDLDQYVKPIMSILVCFGILPPADASVVNELLNDTMQVQTASIGGVIGIIIVAATGGYVIWICCRIRSAILELIHMIDPENDFWLQSVFNWMGEITVIVIILLLLSLSTLFVALILTFIVMLTGVLFQRLVAGHEQKHSHLCTACAAVGKNTLVSDCALICPECGTKQPDVCRVGWFGLSGNDSIAWMSPEQHAFSLLSAHRCRWCASPLDRSHVCPRCGREQWTKELLTYYVQQTDQWRGPLIPVAIPSAPLARIILRLWAIRPLNIHLGTGDRFLTGLRMVFFKMILLVLLLPFRILLLFFSMIPIVGSPTYLLSVWRYNSTRDVFMRTIESRISKVPDDQLKLDI